ncbi:MAG: peptidase [Caulobacterales bacterium]|uniref:peptidase n=1 Tax=Glycocaulis sp. TaxID=1969725 RepID=UPI003FA0D9F5
MKASILVSALALALPGAAALAQDYTLQPNYGTTTLNAGFSPDPIVVQLQSGGSVDASSTLGGNCRGYITNAPDYSVTYNAGSVFPFRIGVASDRDTTLVVNGPDGSWYCDDDGGEGLNPLLHFGSPMSGRYDVWVGTYGSTSNHNAQLFFTELDSVNADTVAYGGGGNYGGTPDWSLNPTYETVNLRGGFTPDPYRVRLQSGGPLSASDTASSNCRGYISEAPDVRLNFQPGSLPLIISVASSADTTLVINGPDGGWYCDDDSGVGTNPSIQWDRPMAGQYDIWVGTYGSTSLREAVLVISELYSE